ncbi:15846_t:CDS:2 [Dentiscutata heterogama]|uniref:15846_t:CDS:1 n=1 Tax=Dentiscutata heterogama TaxID=1316150 RepID=A0ACA9KH14_9GLOM|nr:15846_t:CDS:2 [Dentiscutata heterogama]
MFVGPSLVGSLGRSNWKTIRESPYFLLQKGPQHQNNNSKRIANHNDFNQIKEAFDLLHQEVISGVEGKKSVKKILKQLKIWCSNNKNITLEEVDEYASDTSISPDGNSSIEMDYHDDSYPLISTTNNISSNSSAASTKSNNAIINEKTNITTSMDQESFSQSPERSEFPANHSDYPYSDSSDGEAAVDEHADVEIADNSSNHHVNEWLSIGCSLMDSLMGWFETPPIEGANSVPKQNHATASTSNNKNQTILDIPLQFIDLLTYPEVDTKASKKGSFADKELAGRNNGLAHFSAIEKNTAPSSVKNTHETSGTRMPKHSSQDATIQSGSLSDTTHCGSVVKPSSKRGVFFRKSVQTALTTSHLKDGGLDRLAGNVISSESVSFNGTSQIDFIKSSSASSSSTTPPAAPTSNMTMQTSLNNHPHVSSMNSSNTETQVTTPSTTKRRFFAKRISGHHHSSANYLSNGSNGVQGSSDITDSKMSTSIVPTNNFNTSISNGIIHSTNNNVNGTVYNGNADTDSINFNDSNEYNVFYSKLNIGFQIVIKKPTSFNTRNVTGHRKNDSLGTNSFSSNYITEPPDLIYENTLKV